jgi:hypothetical protein
MKVNKKYVWSAIAISVLVVSSISIIHPVGNPGLWFGLGMCCATFLAYCKCDQFWPVDSKKKKSGEGE